MATIKTILDTRRIRKDGTFPLVIRISQGTQYKDFQTGISCHRNLWNEAKCELRKGFLNFKEINHSLKELQQQYQIKLFELYRSNPGQINFVDIKGLLGQHEERATTVREFWEDEINQLLKSKKYGNARNYKIALDKLSKITNLEIPFEEINFTFLKELEALLRGGGLKTNSISVYFRALRAIYNIAINKEIVDFSYYPFRRFKIISEKTVPHVLNEQELRRFFHLNYSPHHKMFETWLISQLIFLLGGINFIDLIQLSKDNIKQGRVIYTRAKTKKIYSILILPRTQEIIDYFLQKKKDTLCGILNLSEINAGFKTTYTIRDKNKQFNKKLSMISKLLNLSINIRTYTFRYSIANLCKKQGYEIQLISELLGHNYGSSITMGYLDAYEKEKLDEMLTTVCNSVVIGNN